MFPSLRLGPNFYDTRYLGVPFLRKKKKLLLQRFKQTESALYLRTSGAVILTSRLSVGFLTIWTMVDVDIWCLIFFNTHTAGIYEGKILA